MALADPTIGAFRRYALALRSDAASRRLLYGLVLLTLVAIAIPLAASLYNDIARDRFELRARSGSGWKAAFPSG